MDSTLSRHRRSQTPSGLLLIAGVALGLWGSPAHAQDALGDGRALDANLQLGSGGRNAPGRNFAREVAFRNAIVTGNAPGGMSFRGELGYSAADDFRGELGSNEIFDFQRDSFYSSLATRNLGGIDPLRSTLSWSIAGQRDNLFGEIIVSRPGAGVDAGNVGARPAGAPRVDVFSTIDGSMRSASSFMLESEIRPSILGYTQDDSTGEVGIVTASSLLGVRTLPPVSPVFGQERLDILDRLNETGLANATDLTQPSAPGSQTDQTGEAETERITSPNQVIPDRATNPTDSVENQSMFNRVVSSLRTESNIARPLPAGAAPPPTVPTQQPETDTIPDPTQPPTPEEDSGLMPDEPATPGDDADQPDQYERAIERLRESLRLPNLPVPRRVDGPQDPDQPIVPPASTLDLVDEAVRDLIVPGMTFIDSLEPPPNTSATFRRHVRAGEEHLRAGEWFSAEERFTAALSIEPGDPSAAIGRVTAQLGGGMYLSGAINLRDMLRAYPELLAVRFDDALLPDADRTQRIRQQLRQRAETNRPLARDAGLLLAFLGHQTGNTEDIRDGFAIIQRVEQALDLDPDPVHVAARAAWMPSEQPPATPNTDPAP